MLRRWRGWVAQNRDLAGILAVLALAAVTLLAVIVAVVLVSRLLHGASGGPPPRTGPATSGSVPDRSVPLLTPPDRTGR